MSVNPTTVLQEVFAANSALDTATSSRIYAEYLPVSLSDHWQTPEDVEDTILIFVDGEADIEAPRFDVDVTIHCLSATTAGAMTLADLVYDQLDGETGLSAPVAGGVVITINNTGSAEAARDPKTHWYFARVEYSAIITE